ncbi:MAG: nicotinate-nucleotide--dimethylbenzimidazole phosphoribosyltransferase, partial [Pseudomonadota bacterium]
MLSRIAIPPPDTVAAAAAEAELAEKTMPPGALGRVGRLAVTMAAAQGRAVPSADPAEALVFAADHGIVAEGVSAWPQAVTALMVEVLAGGAAAAPVLAQSAGVAITVIDAGVASPYRTPPPGLSGAPVRAGTRNAAIEDALTAEEVAAALDLGAEAAAAALGRGARVLLPGEMGIGNTATAALLAHAVAGLPLDTLTGPGAGLDPAGVTAKGAVLARAAARRPGPCAPEAALACFGGLEVAAMAGAMIAGAGGRAV